ncbi:MAG: alpha-amylase family glycosyl hydrolase, partial [Oceanobacter sp.]
MNSRSPQGLLEALDLPALSKTIIEACQTANQQQDAIQSDSQGDHWLWWKHGVVYQIYPRSFQDSNDDGIGDLQGIIQRLDYLNDCTEESLGVDAIWLSPIFPSPMADFGYDVENYCDIAEEFGSLKDLDDLIIECHKRGIRVILDLVFNHTSDQHPWFKESCQNNSSKRDWYLWHEGKGRDGKDRPNNWLSCFGGPGWTFNQDRNAWYFHSFLPQQPDLNWRNPEVKAALFDIMRFWLDRGVDGFRLDVANFYFKDAKLRDNPVRPFRIARPYDRQIHQFDRDQPELVELFKEMRAITDSYDQRMLVGEIFTHAELATSIAAQYQGQDDALNLTFNFEFLQCPFSAPAFRKIISEWMNKLGKENWPTFTLGNHDLQRMASRYADNGNTNDRMKLLATLLLTLKGTPFLYYGDELGMPEQRVPKDQLQDPAGIQYWPWYPGRDGCRRPMMWSENPEDFSTTQAWLASEPVLAQSYAYQKNLPESLFNWYKLLIHWRKGQP